MKTKIFALLILSLLIHPPFIYSDSVLKEASASLGGGGFLNEDNRFSGLYHFSLRLLSRYGFYFKAGAGISPFDIQSEKDSSEETLQGNLGFIYLWNPWQWLKTGFDLSGGVFWNYQREARLLARYYSGAVLSFLPEGFFKEIRLTGGIFQENQKDRGKTNFLTSFSFLTSEIWFSKDSFYRTALETYARLDIHEEKKYTYWHIYGDLRGEIFITPKLAVFGFYGISYYPGAFVGDFIPVSRKGLGIQEGLNEDLFWRGQFLMRTLHQQSGNEKEYYGEVSFHARFR